MNLSIKHFVMAATFFALADSAFAEQKLSGDEIKKLIVGNTLALQQVVPKNAKYMNYFEAGGSALSFGESGREVKGKWRITEDGLFCTHWETRTETCTQVIKGPDGTYKRIDDGTVRAIWLSITPGKVF